MRGLRWAYAGPGKKCPFESQEKADQLEFRSLRWTAPSSTLDCLKRHGRPIRQDGWIWEHLQLSTCTLCVFSRSCTPKTTYTTTLRKHYVGASAYSLRKPTATHQDQESCLRSIEGVIPSSSSFHHLKNRPLYIIYVLIWGSALTSASLAPSIIRP